MQINYSHEKLTKGEVKFEEPCQCAFQGMLDDNHWFGGIVYQDYVICGCCGGKIDLKSIKELNVFSNWINISDEIMGDGI